MTLLARGREGDIDRIIEERKDAQRMAADPDVMPLLEHGNQEGKNNSRNRDSNTTSVSRGAEYIVRRLKLERPKAKERQKSTLKQGNVKPDMKSLQDGKDNGSTRDKRILQRKKEGATQKAIAEEFGISQRHVGRVLEALDATSKTSNGKRATKPELDSRVKVNPKGCQRSLESLGAR